MVQTTLVILAMLYTSIVHTVVYRIRLPTLVGREIAAQDKTWGHCSHLKFTFLLLRF